MSLPYPNIDPIAISIGPLPIRWYSLSYIAGLMAGWWYLSRLIQNPRLWSAGRQAPFNRTQLDDIIFWVAIGVMAGGRIGYVLFYDTGLLFAPWPPLGDGLNEGLVKTLIGWVRVPPALMLWTGGMAFHGGLIGVTLAGYFYSRRYQLDALRVGDLFACVAPMGLFFGRIANFINGELYGRATDAPWAMVFPTDPLGLPRHPSQLYEAALEGVVLFVVIFIATHRFHILKRPGAAIGLFLAGYAMARIFVENFRQPDAHLPGFPFGLTMGMMLSLPMLAIGVWLIWRTRNIALQGPDTLDAPDPTNTKNQEAGNKGAGATS